MPSRILRDWTDSDRFDGLSAEAERLFVRLLMKADDYGRFHAEPRRLKAALFPLIENLRQDALIRWLDELSTRQLVLLYESSDHRQLLAIPRFGQRLKQSVPKFPAPPGRPDNWLPDCGDMPQPSGQPPPTSGNFPEVPAVFGDVFGDGDVPPPTPRKGARKVHGFPPGFDEFWAAYPRKVGKDAAAKAFAKRRVTSELLAVMLAAIKAQSDSDQWRKDGGQFIPHPATWLNGGRWQDETSRVATLDAAFDAVFGAAL